MKNDNKEVIALCSALAENPHQGFGWQKGKENAIAHGYEEAWLETIPDEVWDYCAAVGNPFVNAMIKEGDTVLDLGCGAGVDVLVASQLVGESGRVIGIDVTPKMVEVATKHAKETGANNVSVLESSFDAIELADESVDVIISNGAINLTSCKESVFAEIYRLLKPKGKLYFADMIDTSIDEGSCCSVQQSACCANDSEEDWANCVAGTMRESELIELIQKARFEDVACTGYTHYTTAETTQGATFEATKLDAVSAREKHWDTIFQNADYTQVLWHQKSPEKSLSLIKHYSDVDANLIDVGCGASYLVDALLENHYHNITLLDTAKYSLEIVKERIHNDDVTFVNTDLLNFSTNTAYALWHDRAVFHFLCTKEERENYFKVLIQTLKPEGIAIISTFRVDGPIQCAGLDIVQYDHNKMHNELPSQLELLESEEYLHITPKDSEQEYIYFVLRKKDKK